MLERIRPSALIFLALAMPTLFLGCGPLARYGYVGSPYGGAGGSSPMATPPSPPSVRVVEVRLAEHPSDRQMAAHFCARHMPSFFCNRIFGADPTDARFAMDIELEVSNPNRVPLPLVQALFAFTAFPEATAQQNLGAVCMSFCEDPTSCPQDVAGACQSDEPEIRDLDSLAQAAVGFLIGLATGQRRVEDLRLRTIPPSESIRAVIRLQIDPAVMTRLMEAAGQDFMSEIRAGRVPRFQIPYSVEGSVWVSVESFGRFAAGFGPFTGTWDLAEEAASAAGTGSAGAGAYPAP